MNISTEPNLKAPTNSVGSCLLLKRQWNLIALLLFILPILAHSLNAASNQIWISTPMTSESQFQHAVQSTSDSISFIEYLEAHIQNSDFDLWNLANENLDIGPDSSSSLDLKKKLSLIVESLLSPSRKRILIHILESISTLDRSIDYGKTIQELKDGINPKSAGLLDIPWILPRPTDRLVINGQNFDSKALNQIRLQPQTLYHWAYLSNSHFPIVKWSTVEDLGALNPIPLLSGDCPHTDLAPPIGSSLHGPSLSFQPLLTDPSPFTKNLYTTLQRPPELWKIIDGRGQICHPSLSTNSEEYPHSIASETGPQVRSEDLTTTTTAIMESETNSPKRIAAFAGGLIFGGFLLHQLNKRYQIDMRFPF